MSKGKKKGIRRRRTKVTSKGTASVSKNPQTTLQKVLLGKGLARNFVVGQPNKKKDSK